MEKIEKRKAFIINIVYAGIIIALFYLGIKFALGVIWPFVIAFFLAMVLQRPVAFLCKKTPLKRGISSTIMVLFVLVIIGSALGLIVYRIGLELRGFFSFLLMKLEDLPAFVEQTTDWLQNALAFLPNSIGESLASTLHDFLNSLLGLEEQALENLPAATQGSQFDFSILSSPLGAVWGTAKQIPMFFVGLLVCIVSCCFMTADYCNLRNMILAQMNTKKGKAVIRTKQIIFSTIGKMVKAYSAIIGITFCEILLGLIILKVSGLYTGGYIFAIALIVAVVDILPVLGTGTILVPWAIISLCTGKIGLGIGLLVIYAIIGVVRQVVEPKLVASQLGMPPFMTIMAMYIGTQLFGFIGLFLLPLTLMLVKVLNDEGIIHIFKTKASVANSAPAPVAAPDTTTTTSDTENRSEQTHD